MTPLQPYFEAVMNWPYFLPCYLAVGFLMGVMILKWPGGRSESPVGSLIMATFAGPLVIATIAPSALVYALFAFICSALNIEAHQGDSHGC
jgi:hypothetical protein